MEPAPPREPPSPRSARAFWAQTLALLAAVCVAFELLCRLALGHAPAIRFDPRYDRVPRGDQPVVQSSEGWSRGRTNALGHLDAELPSPLPADGVLVLGDSYTEARQVAMAERFTDRLGAALHRRVYNVGHTGWSPIHALAFLTAERQTFAPATVILQLSGNDLEDMVATKRGHLVAAGDSYEIAWPAREKRGLAKRITDVREAVFGRSAFAGELVTALLALRGGGGDGGEATGSDHAACTQPDPLLRGGVPWLFGELKRAHPDVRLLYLPTLDYHAGCVDRCAPARAIYAEAAAAQGLPLVDVTRAICARYAETHQPLHGFWNTVPGTGHLNAEGHAVVAHELAAELAHPPATGPGAR